ncbi:melanocyte-stimulating hormone receptor-like [Orbicella faveolata]|uniref:melanocyte-stimulating hormone receptor-like n=1 Tax=Orbicella faveolata TaxID=48498 RepID=UPI0009E409CF|nr:melanocyte-stimulating hormone receptor-like [Orbicella faveolata]
MANITGGANFTSKRNQALTSPPTGVSKFFSALNIFLSILSITASLGNALILIGLNRVSSIYPTTKLFFRCLAVTDLCVGLTLQLLFATTLLSEVNENAGCYSSEVEDVLSWIFCGVSLLTSTAVSVDRLVALLLGLSYRPVVTLRRVRVVIICFWLISALAGSIRMWRGDITFMLSSILLTFFAGNLNFSVTRGSNSNCGISKHKYKTISLKDERT